MSNEIIERYPWNDFESEALHQGHSREYIEKARRYAERLQNKGLPVVFDLKDLALLAEVGLSELVYMVDHPESHYKLFTIKKKHGNGLRRIMTPYQNLKKIQYWIKMMILDKCPISDPHVTGFVQGKSIRSNAQFHENSNVIMKFDIKNFFESINSRRVYKVFERLGYTKELSYQLSRLCTTIMDNDKLAELRDEEKVLFEDIKKQLTPFLPQGAPTSPVLANLVCWRLDKRLEGLAYKLGCNYSRYADDVTFSAAGYDYLPGRESVYGILRDEGFEPNISKTGISHKGQKQKVTGLLVNDRVRVPSAYKRDIYRHLHFCKKFGGREHFAEFAPGMHYGKEWLQGRILFVNEIEPTVAKDMMLKFNEIDWGI